MTLCYDDGCTPTESYRVVEDEETDQCGAMAQEKPRAGEHRNHTGLTLAYDATLPFHCLIQALNCGIFWQIVSSRYTDFLLFTFYTSTVIGCGKSRDRLSPYTSY